MYPNAVFFSLFFSILALMICGFSFFVFRSYLKARTSQERILAEIREEVNNLLKSIDETTERDISLVEEREKRLKSILEEIDKRIKVYIKEMELHRKEEDAYASLRNSKAAATYEKLGKNRYRAKAVEISPAPSPVESPPARLSMEAPSVSAQIRSLVKAGLSTPLIASRLGISIAEVELASAIPERRESKFVKS